MESTMFTSEEDEKLIELVRENKVLYDYKDNHVKHEAWKKIGSELGRSADDCEARWHTIYDSYLNSCRENEIKANTTGSSAFSKSINKGKHLQFLDYIFKERRMRTNMATNAGSQYEKLEETDEVNYNAEVERIQEGIIEDGLLGNLENEKLQVGVQSKSVISDEKQDFLAQKNKMLSGALEKILADVQKGREDRHKLLKDHFESLRKEPEKKNIHPMELFLKSMCERAKTFPPHIAAETKLKICQVMSEMELKMIQEQNERQLTAEGLSIDTRTVKPNDRVYNLTSPSKGAAGSSSCTSFSIKVKKLLGIIVGKD